MNLPNHRPLAGFFVYEIIDYIDNMNKYVHGYSDDEANRLNDQADSLSDLLHYDSIWDEGSIILEAGCGIGAQKKSLLLKIETQNLFQ